MDLGSISIGAILLAICIVPFILMSRGRNKIKKQLLQSLNGTAKQHNCQISQYEFCGDYLIGIDEVKNVAFFHKHSKDSVIEQFVDLANFKNCKIINLSRLITNKEGNYKIIDKLKLSLMPILNNNPEMILEFFNSDINAQLYDELQSIEKWSRIINERLKVKI